MKKFSSTLFLLIVFVCAGTKYTYAIFPIAINNIVKETPNTYYQIVGDSPSLSPRERSALVESRKRVVELANANKDIVFINGPASAKAVALTFDDGPDAVITPAILDVLKSNNVKASFFFIGNILDSYPEVVKRADREGNLVLNHSYSHPEFSKLSPDDIRKELNLTDEKIFSMTGKKPAVVRPPYGNLNQYVINQVSRDGYKIAMWSIDTVDWAKTDKDTIIKNVVDNIRPGDIISGHSIANKKTTLEALPEIIKRLKAMGYTFLTLDKLLGIKAYQ